MKNFSFLSRFSGLFLAALTLGLSAHANSGALQDYLQVQKSLAHDQFSGVTELAQKLAKDAKLEKQNALSKSAVTLAHAKDLSEARFLFEDVSDAGLPYFKTLKKEEFETVYCPMKKKSWAQSKGPIENPFYGKEMLECGVKR